MVYGSLLPFQYRPLEWEQAVATFARIPWLTLGLGSRLDWLANVILYVPVGWLGTMALAGTGPTWRRRLTAAVLALGLGALLAIAVEFTQIYFAPRTVSLNDLVGEGLGTVLGCAGAIGFGPALGRLLQRAAARQGTALKAWMQLYLLAYLALSLFPFDFTMAAAVFQQKLELGHAGWVWAPINAGRPVLALTKLGADALLVLPFGWVLARSTLRMHWVVAAVIGAIAGVVIEGLQLLLLTATSQGVSVLARAAGMGIGAWLALRTTDLHTLATPARLRSAVALLALPWLLLLAALSGWGQVPVQVTGWAARAAELNYLPFFYHYYVGESRALTSVLLCVGSYLWVGVAAALVAPRAGPWLPALTALAVSAGLEASQLLLQGRRPDPTNPWLAACAAWLAFAAIRRLRGLAVGAEPAAGLPAAEVPVRRVDTTPAPATALAIDGWAVGAAVAVAVAAQVSQGHVIGLLLAAAAFITGLWWRPASLPLLLPVALVLTDVDTYTGLRWFDLTDALMLGTLAVAVLHPATRRPPSRPLAWWPAGALALLGLVPAVLVGLGSLDADRLPILLTPLDEGRSLWMAKGLLWAAVVALAWRRLRLDNAQGVADLGRGMCLALAGVVALTVYERLAFVGPLDFSTTYRAPGPFTAIALGGAYIECFLAAATPFAVVAALHERSLLVRWACGLLVLGAAYATMVTFSRAGQVVFLAVVLLTALWTVLQQRQRFAAAAAPRRRARPQAVVLLAAVAGVSATILLAPFATARFERLGEDAQGRLQHWREGLSMGRDDLATLALGNGLGRFGHDAYVQGTGGGRPGMFTFQQSDGNTWLTVHPGRLSYLDQRVSVQYGEPLTFSARIRATQAGGLEAMVCEKDLVQSAQCAVARLRPAADGQWQQVTLPLKLAPNPHAGFPPRPLRFTLFKGGSGAPVDIDDLSLTNAQGRELLHNGNFQALGSHWLYASDMHLVWHLKSLWLQVFYESGCLGVAAHVLLLALAALGAWQAARFEPQAFALLMALLAFHGVGVIDSVIDSPRFLLLYLSLALVGCALRVGAGPPGRLSTA